MAYVKNGMTVEQLIEQLKKCDPKAKVGVFVPEMHGDNIEWENIEDMYEIHPGDILGDPSTENRVCLEYI